MFLMKENNAPKAIRLKDYCLPDYLIDTTVLRFELGEDLTRVVARIRFHTNPAVVDAITRPLELTGVDQVLLSIALDGITLTSEQYRLVDEQLIIPGVPENFELVITTHIKPQLNTSLEGLYKSNGMFCTQCEAEGFRKITYYLDRPDVMARFTTTVVADKTSYPVLLSNGNPVARGELEDGRHWVTWEDPFHKPCYLFALVAGDLGVVEDRFTTCSGRDVLLQVFVEAHDIDKCDHALQSLKRAMKWDEEIYGREYDLDIYMIVAVSHFNMGAMENKGLNIFNTSCVLARPETATDKAFDRVEGVIAHEYFHNWSGNRVTCRDWFQLSLKEGFTVFRDESFSADMGSTTVKRVEKVAQLRTVQFGEDAGPMAHPVRPDTYIEINNFYTSTVYEKGAEVVRMIHTLVGAEGFRQGTDLYFDRHDGQAVTCEDFLKAMEDANGIDLAQFQRWYHQAGTPVVEAIGEYDEGVAEYRLTLSQTTAPTPMQPTKLPFLVPVSVGLLDSEGKDIPLRLKGGATAAEGTLVLQLKEARQTFVFTGIEGKPVLSLLRGFSAPVKVIMDISEQESAFLMAHDSDGFNRWNAGNNWAVKELQSLMADVRAGKELILNEHFAEVIGKLLRDDQLDKAMLALMLELPTEAYLAEISDEVDVDAIHQARHYLKQSLAARWRESLIKIYQENLSADSYVYQFDAAARRSLRNVCLGYLITLEDDEVTALALRQFEMANNMTDQAAALRCLAHSSKPERGAVLASFYAQWQNESLVVDQWLSIQATSTQPGTLEAVENLMAHPAFELSNPNKVRALIGAFCNGNPVHFHHRDGSGYRFLADRIIELNEVNPMIASRMTTLMMNWRKYDKQRAGLMEQELHRIMAQPLSSDVYEIVSKALA